MLAERAKLSKFLLGASALLLPDERLSCDGGLTRLKFSTEEEQTDLRGKAFKKMGENSILPLSVEQRGGARCIHLRRSVMMMMKKGRGSYSKLGS